MVLQYLAFETKGVLREYAFSLRELGGESSNYFVTIANEAFSAHRARYQDAPAICSIRLRRELAAGDRLTPFPTFSVTGVGLAEYSHTHKAKRAAWRSAENF